MVSSSGVTVGAAVGGAAGAAVCTAAGATGALVAYRRHQDLPTVDAEGIADAGFEVADDNVVFTPADLESMNDNVMYDPSSAGASA